MTLEELKEKAKEMGYSLDFDIEGEEYLYKSIKDWFYCFRKEGAVDDGKWYGIIAEHRTPEQMLMIMRGLE